MYNYQSIRNEIYNSIFAEFDTYIKKIKSPYSYLKSIYYIETASIFLFISQNLIKSPNFVTFLYIFFGVLGAFLINAQEVIFFYIGVFMTFSKGTFDWADGPLARRLNKTSFLGKALDVYGAELCDIAFRISFIFYCLKNFPQFEFIMLPILFLIMIVKFNVFSGYLFYKETINNFSNYNSYLLKSSEYVLKDSLIKKLYFLYISLLDARARSVDFLLLILILDKNLQLNLDILLIILVFLIVIRSVVMYLAGIYMSFKAFKG